MCGLRTEMISLAIPTIFDADQPPCGLVTDGTKNTIRCEGCEVDSNVPLRTRNRDSAFCEADEAAEPVAVF